MDTLWAKFKLWTKLLIVGVLAVVFIFFLYGNWNEHVSRLDLVFHQWTNVRLLTLIFFTAVVSIFGWWLFWTLFRTIRQVRRPARSLADAEAGARGGRDEGQGPDAASEARH